VSEYVENNRLLDARARLDEAIREQMLAEAIAQEAELVLLIAPAHDHEYETGVYGSPNGIGTMTCRICATAQATGVKVAMMFKESPSGYLTQRERDLVAKIGECASEFGAIRRGDADENGDNPGFEGDGNEFCAAVHVMQRMVMARAAQRAHPDEYTRQPKS